MRLRPRQPHTSMVKIGKIALVLLAMMAAGLLLSAFGRHKVVEQPLPFRHDSHMRLEGMQCLYCHINARRSDVAGLPSLKRCMGCHENLKASTFDAKQRQALEPLQKHWTAKAPVAWVKVYDQPDHVRFSHKRHLEKEIACKECHGSVETMEHVEEVIDWTMGRCVSCHMEQQASIDCVTCHK